MDDNSSDYFETTDSYGDDHSYGDGDSYTEVTTTSWWDELVKSLVGVLVGLLLFFGSFVMLFMNEGRPDFSQAANSAVVIAADRSAPGAQGKIVAITGPITTPETIGDKLYIKPGAYVALARTVEMYAWDETKDTQETKQLGGGKQKTTTYHYKKVWTNRPESSSSFKQSQTHQNPAKAIADGIFKVTAANIGRYGVDMAHLADAVHTGDCGRSASENVISSQARQEGLALGPAILLSQAQSPGPLKAQLISDRYLFRGAGTMAAPRIGDLRICYTALPSQATVTLFGKLQANLIGVARYHKEDFFRIFLGDRAAAIGQLQTEYQIWLWALRVCGFLMMWIGLSLILGPLGAIANVIPFLGDLVEMVSGLASFGVALGLSAVTILVSSLLHNPVVLAVTVLVALGAFVGGRLVLNASRA